MSLRVGQWTNRLPILRWKYQENIHRRRWQFACWLTLKWRICEAIFIVTDLEEGELCDSFFLPPKSHHRPWLWTTLISSTNFLPDVSFIEECTGDAGRSTGTLLEFFRFFPVSVSLAQSVHFKLRMCTFWLVFQTQKPCHMVAECSHSLAKVIDFGSKQWAQEKTKCEIVTSSSKCQVC